MEERPPAFDDDIIISYYDTIMSKRRPLSNDVKRARVERNWSQEELARRAGISRAAVSAIEINRLVPSVAAALALARSFGCPVETLFGHSLSQPHDAPQWTWPPRADPCRFWQVAVGGRQWLYPVETTASGIVEHDGLFANGARHYRVRPGTEKTLVLGCCDPAAALLGSEIRRQTGIRVIVLPRSSQESLSLLAQGLIHAAGVHLATNRAPRGNQRAVREHIQSECQLMRVAHWQEGLAVSEGAAIHSVRSALRGGLRWIGRQPGSAARQCQDELLEGRPPPRRQARDHRSVADAIRNGWADAGICLRLVSDEAGLRFLPIRQEIYEWCIPSGGPDEILLQALRNTIQSSSYRKLLQDLPGYDPRDCGEMQWVN
jgi:molybdate-binding protein/DNA-binding XRE family transcriptional regulator